MLYDQPTGYAFKPVFSFQGGFSLFGNASPPPPVDFVAELYFSLDKQSRLIAVGAVPV